MPTYKLPCQLPNAAARFLNLDVILPASAGVAWESPPPWPLGGFGVALNRGGLWEGLATPWVTVRRGGPLHCYHHPVHVRNGHPPSDVLY